MTIFNTIDYLGDGFLFFVYSSVDSRDVRTSFSHCHLSMREKSGTNVSYWWPEGGAGGVSCTGGAQEHEAEGPGERSSQHESHKNTCTRHGPPRGLPNDENLLTRASSPC